jgi:hypothetical protein
MKVAIVVALCHTPFGQPDICSDKVAFDVDAMGIGCLIGEAQVIEWKAHSIYAGVNWTVSNPRCAPGGYVIRERT